MDKKILQKYFRNQCSFEEIEKVLNWFQTQEGQLYLEERLDRDMQHYGEEKNLILIPEIPSEKILQNIERKRKGSSFRIQKKQKDHWWLRVAVVLMVCGFFAGSGYWMLQYFVLQNEVIAEEQVTEVILRTISTTDNQHRLVTLGDGTQIRLNENSSIELPEQFPADNRNVRLTGEAYFNIARDEGRPFTVEADQAVIRVLGTEFNVKVIQSSREVQVAVVEGRVSLSEGNDTSEREVILTENTFGLLYMDSGEILLERSSVNNYLSWISGNLYFYNDSLLVVSRFIERLYGVSLQFENNDLKNLNLSVNIMKRDLDSVLGIISQTLEISYRYENDTVIWIEGR